MLIIATINMKRYNQFKDSEKEFYFYLGLLSTKFSIIEFNTIQLLGKLISDDFVITNTLLERNSLAQNIELLKKVIKRIKFEQNSLANLIDMISNVRKKRNLFIHGLWSTPIEVNNDIEITCNQPRLDYQEEKENDEVITQIWSSTTQYSFKLSYIKKLTETLNDITTAQCSLLLRLEDFEQD